MKVVEQDKAAMLEAWRSKRSGNVVAESSIDESISIPPLTQSVDEKDGWITFDKPSLYIYVGKGPYAGRCVIPGYYTNLL
jgi:sphingosine kinase